LAVRGAPLTDYADFVSQIKEWENRGDWSDALSASFVRMAEEKFNDELRIDRMLKTVVNTVDHDCAKLPDDWLESELMLIQTTGAPTGWTPIRYQPRDEFFRSPSATTPYYSLRKTTYSRYTIQGRTIYFGGAIDPINGQGFRMDYFARVPIFSDTVPSWVYTYHPGMYLAAARGYAKLHAVGEEDKAGGMKMLVEDQIQKLNNDYLKSKSSGSRLSRGHTRSFG
jgi:hypothetical protein